MELASSGYADGMTTLRSQSIDSPHPLLLASEIPRALMEIATGVLSVPLLRAAADGDGHTVLVLPGLITGDESTLLLRRYLRAKGYDAQGWGLGRNYGPRRGVEEGMGNLLQQAVQRSGRSVSLVGWSLGGVYARLLAARFPHDVRNVITLGSPFTGTVHATHAWRVYEAVSGQKAEGHRHWDDIQATPAMPCTSIYSRTDGVVAWRCSLERVGPQSENIEIIASHLGMGFHPAVVYAVADRLAQPEGTWAPFECPRLGLRWLYPEPAVRN